MKWPAMLKFVFPKTIGEVKQMDTPALRKKYGPILTAKLKADIVDGKVQPKVYLKEA